MAVEDGGGGGDQKIMVTQIEGRGRAVVASKPLTAGEIILKDSPILLYSALPLNPYSTSTRHHQNQNLYCSHCFKILSNPPSVLPCPLCSSTTAFCGPTCRSTALISSHTPWVCQTLTRLRDCKFPSLHTEELQIQARFLVAAYNLSRVSPCDFQTLLSLQGGPSEDANAVFLHSLISSLCNGESISFTLELTAALLAKDKLNAFGLMEPFGDKGERSVRAYGIYPNSSFFNHDCLPNACRFDYVDSNNSADGSNVDVVVRAIHDVPQGREICLSYFPVNLKYSERQRRLKEDYGFTCTCDRCNVEANWSDNEEEEEEAMEEDNDELMVDLDNGVKEVGEEEEEEDESDFPHAYFFLRYMCTRENCWGTLAPLPPSNGAVSSVMECNVCGNLKRNDDGGGIDGDDALEEE